MYAAAMEAAIMIKETNDHDNAATLANTWGSSNGSATALRVQL
jgi:hypothetical protein